MTRGSNFRKAFVYGVFMCLTIPSFSKPAVSWEHDTRIGITFLGTGFLSLSVERHFGDNSIRINTGVFEFQELCVAVTANRYFTDSEFKPHVGIGVWNVLIFPEGKLGRLDMLNVPIGVDWEVSDRHYAGVEMDLNYFMHGRNPGGGKITFDKEKRFLPLPALYYKYGL